MKRALVVTIFASWIGIIFLPQSGGAQDNPGVRDLTHEEVTMEKLIETLSPPLTKGIAPIEAPPVAPAVKPQCKIYQERSRGIVPASEVPPVSAAVGINLKFAYNSAEIAPEATRTLETVAGALKSSKLGGFCFQIEGHTDSMGSDSYNQRLSERRARRIVRYLTEHAGIEADRLIAVGYGKSKPIADNKTISGRQSNRRVQIVNLGAGESASN